MPLRRRGQAVEHHVDLELGALRRARRSGRAAEQPPEDGGGDGGEDRVAGDRVLAGAVAPGDLARGVDRGDLGTGPQLGAGAASRRLEGRADRAHPASRDAPRAADDVVEEAAVLAQRGLVECGERADQAIGRDHAADEGIGEACLEGLAERAADEVVEGLVAEQRAGPGTVGERLAEALVQPGGPLQERIERQERGVLALGAGDRGERGRGRRRRRVALDEQPGRTPVAEHGDVGRHGPVEQAQVDSQLAGDPGREQRDEVGVARQPRIDAPKGTLADRRAAEALAALEDQHPPARSCQVARGDQRVVAAADDHGPGNGHPRTVVLRRASRRCRIPTAAARARAPPRAAPRSAGSAPLGRHARRRCRAGRA